MSPTLHVLSILDAPTVTGPARGLIHLARHLPPEVRLHVAMLRGADAPPPPRLDEFTHGAMTVHEIPEAGPFDPRIFARAIGIARRERIGIIQSHSYKPHVIALGVRAALGTPWVGHHHGWTAENRKVKLYHQVDGLTLPRADRVVAVAGSARDIVVSEGVPAGRVVLIPNAVEAHDLRTELSREEARAKLGIPHGRTVGAVVGRLSHEKGQDVALQALARVREENVDVVLAFAGDGPDRASLEALTDTLGLRDRVVFLGHQKSVGVVYAASDFLLMPSRSEAMPNALLEAMTVSLPVVATRVGGVPEVANDGEHIWIVPSEDPRWMAAALLHCVRDPDERARRAARARERAEINHDPKRRARRYLDLYETLLARPLTPWN